MQGLSSNYFYDQHQDCGAHMSSEERSSTIEAMTQALEALEESWRTDKGDAAITALRTAIEQAEKQSAERGEPVAWMWEQKATKSSSGIGGWDKLILFCKPVHDPFVEKRNLTPLYITPPAAPVQEPVASAWMHNGKMVNAFPWPPSDPRAADKDGHWRDKGYASEALYITPPAYDQGWKDGYKHGAWASTAAPVQEPVAWGVHDQIALNKAIANHSTPAAQRQWVGLDKEEIEDIAHDNANDNNPWCDIAFARAIEAKLREKNGG
jgi:hypothetical protein